MEIYILRHGTTEWNEEHRIQGSTDTPLDSLGVEMARLTGERFRELGLRFDRVYSSPLSRAYETTKLVLGISDENCDSGTRTEDEREIPGIITDVRLKELSFGNQEGRFISELLREDVPFIFFKDDPAEYNRRAELEPSAESLTDLCRRTEGFLREVVEGGGRTADFMKGANEAGGRTEDFIKGANEAGGRTEDFIKGVSEARCRTVDLIKGDTKAGFRTDKKMPQRILISAHGACNKGLLMHIRGERDLRNFWGNGLQPNCGVDVVHFDEENGAYRILEENRIFYPEEILKKAGTFFSEGKTTEG